MRNIHKIFSGQYVDLSHIQIIGEPMHLSGERLGVQIIFILQDNHREFWYYFKRNAHTRTVVVGGGLQNQWLLQSDEWVKSGMDVDIKTTQAWADFEAEIAALIALWKLSE